MRSTMWTAFYAAMSLFCVLSLTVGVSAGPFESEKESNAKEDSDSSDVPDEKRVSVDDARQRAKLSHNIYAATLEVMHHRYFRDERASVPARALEDVFSEIADQENINANWIAVNAKAMSINHKPKDEFEKQAAKAIAAGKDEYELVENGVYRRAEGISLMNRGCLVCHLGFGASGKTKRFAGLVISIPVKTEKQD